MPKCAAEYVEWACEPQRGLRGTKTVVSPESFRFVDTVQGMASKRGVEYEVANGDKILHLGEELMPAVTHEGS